MSTTTTLPLGAIRFVLSDLLDANGLTQMSKDVLKVTDVAVLRSYATICVNASPEKYRERIASRFRAIGVL